MEKYLKENDKMWEKIEEKGFEMRN